jgi:mono/diheme cytochrome c family protein
MFETFKITINPLTRCCPLAALIAVGFLTISTSWADEQLALPPPSAKKDLTYAKNIRPLFEQSCFKCHGEEKQKKKLRLDSLDAVLKGAGDEKVVVSGNSAKSKLVQVIAHATQDEDEWMPPQDKGKPLTPEEIGLVRAWIDQGAK